MKFNEYRELRETTDFNLKFKILLKQIEDSGQTFDEYWISHGLPRLIEGAYSNHDELLDRMLIQEVDWRGMAGRGLEKAGGWAQRTGQRWQQPRPQDQQQAQQGGSPFADPTQSYSQDVGSYQQPQQPHPAVAAAGNLAGRAMDAMGGSQGGMADKDTPVDAEIVGDGQQQQQGASMEDNLTQNFAKSLQSFLQMSQDPTLAPAAQQFAKEIDIAGKPIIQKMISQMRGRPASQTAGMGNQGVGAGSQDALGSYSYST